MKIAGIIGGIGPASTIEYYRQIVDGYRKRVPDGGYPNLIVNSVDLKAMLDLVSAGRLDELAHMLGAEIGRLARAGADFGALAANTPHIVFHSLAEVSPIPLLSIVEATAAEAKSQGFKRAALFGTRFTMQSGIYRRALERVGVELVLPEHDEQEDIHAIYMGELLHSVVRNESRERLKSIIAHLRQGQRIDALILGGTELPLLLGDDSYEEVKVLDTTKLHVARILDELLG